MLKRPALVRMPADEKPDEKHAETESILQEVVKVFRERADVDMVRASGRTIAELEAVGEAKHKQMKDSIKGACQHAVACARTRGARVCLGHALRLWLLIGLCAGNT